MIKSTGQMWKLHIMFAGLFISGFFIFIPQQITKYILFFNPIILNIIGIVLCFFSFLFACISIKCPSCNDNWFLRSIRSNSVSNWLSWLLNQNECPNCKKVNHHAS